MSEEKKDEKPTFKVTDRRQVGRAASPEEPGPAPRPTPPTAAEPPPPRPEPPPAPEPHAGPPPPLDEAGPDEGPVDFPGLVISLAHTALFQLGELADPMTGERGRDLRGASRTIDILAMLREKTRGNLGPEEQQVLEGALSELKVRFVRASGLLKR